MSIDALASGARKRPWRRLILFGFSLILICIAAWWLSQPKRVAATALFEVRNEQASLVARDSDRMFLSKEEFEIIKNTQIALLKSRFVLSSALVNPGIASLSVLGSSDDKEAWLQDHLEIEYPHEGEILSISL